MGNSNMDHYGDPRLNMNGTPRREYGTVKAFSVIAFILAMITIFFGGVMGLRL